MTRKRLRSTTSLAQHCSCLATGISAQAEGAVFFPFSASDSSKAERITQRHTDTGRERSLLVRDLSLPAQAFTQHSPDSQAHVHLWIL